MICAPAAAAQTAAGGPQLARDQPGLLQLGHVLRGGRRWEAKVCGDPVDRHDPVAQVAEDPQPRLARERLEDVERPAVSLARIDMGAPSQDGSIGHGVELSNYSCSTQGQHAG